MSDSTKALRRAADLAQEGRGLEAIECLEVALAQLRGSSAGVAALAKMAGLLSSESGDLAGAARYYEEALVSGEPDPLLFVALARVQRDLGDRGKAQVYLSSGWKLAIDRADRDEVELFLRLASEWGVILK